MLERINKITPLRIFASKLYSKLAYKKRDQPIYIFCYHKVGTVLFEKVFSEICDENGWKFESRLGKQTKTSYASDVVLFGHSLIDVNALEKPFLGIHLIRDPRDILVSGYLYHKKTDEEWCTNRSFDQNAPIMFPKVPYSQQHRSEEWKKTYLDSLGNTSYQQNLLNLPQNEGLLFEMENYGSWTLESMNKWNYHNKNILQVKFEKIMSDYDTSFHAIFKHLDFTNSQLESAQKIAEKHDLARKSDKEIQSMNHVHSRKTRKWKGFFEENHKIVFREKFGNILVNLGYENTNNW